MTETNWKQIFIDLFDQIQHGDKEHRKWLRDKIIEFANSKAILALGTFDLKKKDFKIRRD